MKCGAVEEHYETPYFHPQHGHPPTRYGGYGPPKVWPSQDQRGSGLTASAPVTFEPLITQMGMASSAACECGAENHNIDHVLLHCPVHRPPHGALLDDETIKWL